MKKLLIISLCTTGVMREHFICYSNHLCKYFDLYCVTNDNIDGLNIKDENCLNVRYKRQEKFGYFSLKKIHLIKKFIKKVRPDAIYVFTPHPVNILLARFLRKYKLIFQVHDPEPHSRTSLIDSFVIKKQIKQYYKYSDMLIVAGEKLKEKIYSQNKSAGDKVKVVKFGVLDNLLFEVPEYSKKYDMVFFGRIEYYKGLDLLIKANNILNNKYSCLLIGKGDINKACGENISLNENYTFINRYVLDEELARYICESKIVVLPYRDATGSMTIGISHFYGKPVIASNTGTFEEYLSDGGLIFESGDAETLAKKIELLLSNDDLYNSLSQNAIKNYNNNFKMDDVIKSTAKYINELIGEKYV